MRSRIIQWITTTAVLFMLAVPVVQAQQLVFSGKIIFERRENVHKQFLDEDAWSEAVKKQIPKYKVDQFQLAFNGSQSLYRLFHEDEGQFGYWGGRVAYNNTISTSFDRKQVSSEKTVYEMEYRIEDSIPAYQWKMLGEFREIAGYNCRKAATIIMDSLYVIAFYTDQIPVSAGPESLQGLPGMILGVVIPRLNITIFATKVDASPPNEKDLLFIPQKKTKVVNKKAFMEELSKAVGDWGKYGGRVLFKAVY